MEKIVSHSSSALAVEDKEEILEAELTICLHETNRLENVTDRIKPNFNVIKVSGSITVSF